MKKHKVLVVDDSAVMRKKISELIVKHEDYSVIGKARNGIDMLEKTKMLKPDLIVMDVDMPEMSGIEVLERHRQQILKPVILLDDSTIQRERAISLGAIALLEKKHFFESGMQHIEIYFKQKSQITCVEQSDYIQVRQQNIIKQAQYGQEQKIIIIGSSTGGPAALQVVLTNLALPINIPIVIVQHIPEGFTKPLADRFNDICAFPVKEAEDGEVLQMGSVYIAPAGKHTLFIQNDAGQYIIRLKNDTVHQTLYKPSIDVALLSIAQLAQKNAFVAILTGMGDDGLKGSRDIKKHGGQIVTQDESSCVVYGMPKVVEKAGLSDKQLSLKAIAHEMNKLMNP